MVTGLVPVGTKPVSAVTTLVLVVTKSVSVRGKPSLVRTKTFFIRTKVFFIGEKTYLILKRQNYAVKIAVNPQGEIKMPKVQIKRIKEKVLRILNAWLEGATAVIEFRSTKRADFEARIVQAQVLEDEAADLRAQASLKDDQRDAIYRQLEADAVDIREGVEGHKDYGDDSPLYGLMGFVRKSERKSGLTHKKKAGKPEKDEDK